MHFRLKSIAKFIKSKLALVAQIGADPNDNDELRIRKKVFVLVVLLFDVPTSVIQGVLFFSTDEKPTAFLYWGWAFIDFANLGLFGMRRLAFYTFAKRLITLVLFMPLLITITLGGIVNSGAQLALSFIAPLGASIFLGTRAVFPWMCVQIGIVVTGALIDPFIRTAEIKPINEITTSFVFNMINLSIVVVIGVMYFVKERDQLALLLRHEQEKSEALLLNVLPQEIADILKNEERSIADQFDEASVLFADIINFTPLSSHLTPQSVVNLLNDIFSQFDALVENYGLEKIKTIGDCYMVASGVPRPRADHAQALACFALDMRECIASIPLPEDIQLSFRVGINSGPLIAGVIGRKKFIYDLWGDTVNTASRMESHGSAGRIQITQATYELLEADFLCEPCGTIMVKGKGEMDVWYLEGRKT